MAYMIDGNYSITRTAKKWHMIIVVPTNKCNKKLRNFDEMLQQNNESALELAAKTL